MSNHPIVKLDDEHSSKELLTLDTLKELRVSRAKKRWISLAIGWLIMCVSGTQYLFSVISPDLKETLDYSQSQINLVGTFSNFGIYFFGVGVGLFYDRFGFKWTVGVGGLFMGLGYFCIWILAKEAQPHFTIMALYLCLMGTGSSGAYTAALATNVKNWPAERLGIVSGFLVSGFGLCASIFTTIYKVIFAPDVLSLLLFLSIALAVIPWIGVFFISDQTWNPKIDDENYGSYKEESYEKVTNSEQIEYLTNQPKRDFTYVQMLKTIEFYLVFFIFGAVAGTGFVIFNNLGSLVKSLGGKNGDQDVYVIVLSLFNFLSRVAIGLMGDQTRKIFSRPWYFVLISLVMMVAMFTLIFVNMQLLWLAVILTGISYGFLMSVTPSFVSEYYGNTCFGGNWGIVRASPGIGSFFLATLLAGAVYESKAAPGEKDCHGEDCYRLVFIITALLCLFCALLGVVLVWKTRQFYRSLTKK